MNGSPSRPKVSRPDISGGAMTTLKYTGQHAQLRKAFQQCNFGKVEKLAYKLLANWDYPSFYRSESFYLLAGRQAILNGSPRLVDHLLYLSSESLKHMAREAHLYHGHVEEALRLTAYLSVTIAAARQERDDAHNRLIHANLNSYMSGQPVSAPAVKRVLREPIVPTHVKTAPVIDYNELRNRYNARKSTFKPAPAKPVEFAPLGYKRLPESVMEKFMATPYNPPNGPHMGNLKYY